MKIDYNTRKLLVGYGLFLNLTGLRDSDELFEEYKASKADQGGAVTYKGKRYEGLNHYQQMAQVERFKKKGAK